MILIPSIELSGGRVIATNFAPDLADVEILADDPLVVARALRDEGALFFHLVDCDAIAGTGDQLEVVAAFVAAELPCEVAGAVTTVERVEALLASGADRVVIDPAMLAGAAEVRELVERRGARLAVGLDVDGEQVRAIGRRPEATLPFDEVVATLGELGVRRVVHRGSSDAEGPDVGGVKALLAAVEAEVFAAAQVRSKRDLESLTALADDGLAGIVLEEAARALLERAQR